MTSRTSRTVTHQGEGSLRDSALAPATLRTYTINFKSFLRHARLRESDFHRKQPHRIDALLADYIEHQYRSGRPYDYACQAVYGCQFMRPGLKG